MSVKDLDITRLANLAKGPLYVKLSSETKEVSSPPKKIDEQKRRMVFAALERVERFCDLHLNLPGTTLDREMLERGKNFAVVSLDCLRKNEHIDDIPFCPYLSDYNSGYYRHIVRNLSFINVNFVSSFIFCWKSEKERAVLRRGWDISIGSVKPPMFLRILTPRNRKELYGND